MARRSGSKPKGETVPEVAMSDAGSSDWEIDANDKAPKHKAEAVLEKDEDEEELERLVLGDRAAFRAQLFTAADLLGDDAADGTGPDALALATVDADAGAHEDDEFEDADDAQMFLYDETALAHVSHATPAKATGRAADANAPAWEDSDDERLVVSLAGRTQFRKLRTTADDDLVSGTEYTARIRQQYLRLCPTPAWAVEADRARVQRIRDSATHGGVSRMARKAEKRMRRAAQEERLRRRAARESDASASEADDVDAVSDSTDSTDSDSDSDNEGNDLLQAALPLDKFLRSTTAMAGAGAAASGLFAAHGGRAARRLRPEVLDIQKSRDMPTQHKMPVTSLHFHPDHDVLLSSSLASVLHLHQVAPGAYPTPNPLLSAVRVRQAGVRCTEFVRRPGGATTEIVFAGRRKYFHSWDMASGRVQRVSRVQGHALEHKSMERFHVSTDGRHMAIIATNRKRGGILNVLDTTTMMWVAQARQESIGGIADFAWWRDGAGLTILGRDGRVGEWCLATRRFVAMWRDSGSTGGTALGLGGAGGPEALGGDRWLCLGSKSGIANVYDRALLFSTTGTDGEVVVDATPLRVLEQLTTPVTSIVFAPDGQVMALASEHKRDALRLVHLPTATVYRNWPTAKTPLGKVTAIAFGRGSEYLAVGNDQGKTRLWEIRG